MSLLNPVTESAASGKAAEVYERLREMFAGQEIPAPILMYGNAPSFLHDFYMNFKKFVYADGLLDAKTKATLALAVSSVFRCPAWIEYFAARCQQLGFGPAHTAETLAVAATCEMYNVFFKFRDVSGSDIYGGMSVGLRAHTFAGTSLDDKTVELINVVISDINGCKPCTSGHVGKARQLGLKDEAIHEAIQCAATMTAGCSFLNAAG